MKRKIYLSIIAGIAAFIVTPLSVYFTFNNDERSYRVDPKPVNTKNLYMETNPFNYYNQDAFNHNVIFENNNGYINGEIIRPFGYDVNFPKRTKELKLFKIIKDNGHSKIPDIDENDYILVNILQKPKSNNINDIDIYSSSIEITIDKSNAASLKNISPEIELASIKIDDRSSWASSPNNYMYEEIGLYSTSKTILNPYLVTNNEIKYKFDTISTQWFGIGISGYSNKEYTYYELNNINNGANNSYVPDFFFQTNTSFLNPTLKYDINKSKGNNFDSRNYLYDKYGKDIGYNGSLITDGETTAYGRLTQTIDFREPYIHNNYHVSKAKQEYDDLPFKNEYWNMMNYIPDINNKWKFEIDLNARWCVYLVTDMKKFDKFVNTELDLESWNVDGLLWNYESSEYFEKIDYSNAVSGKYIFWKENNKIYSKHIPKPDTRLVVSKNNGIGQITNEYRKFNGNISSKLYDDGYMTIMANDFIDINNNQVIVANGDEILSHSKMTIYNDLNGNGEFDQNEKYTILIEEGSPTTSNSIWHWGGKRYSNPVSSKFILDWNNNGPEYWNFYVINPIQITGIILVSSLVTILLFEFFTVLGNEEKRNNFNNIFKKFIKSNNNIYSYP